MICTGHSILIYMLKPPLELGGGGSWGEQLPSKAHVNFRQFMADFGVAYKLLSAVVNLNFPDNLQYRLLTKIPLFMQWYLQPPFSFWFRAQALCHLPPRTRRRSAITWQACEIQG